MKQTRTLFLNMAAGLGKQVVTLLCGFILPRFMLISYGSTVNGLISTITNYLSFIALLEMGVGAVIQSNLYEPLAVKDNDEVSRIIKSSQRFFQKIAMILIIYIVVLIALFITVFDFPFDSFFCISLLIIVASSTFSQYFFGITYQLLLNADQKSYVTMTISLLAIVCNTIASIILMKAGASIHLVEAVSSLIFMMRPVAQKVYINRHYTIDTKIKLTYEPIKQKWNGFSQHIASVICQNVDIAVLSVFSTLENVSIYSIYYMVIYGVEQIVLTAATGIESFFGNMLASKELNLLNCAFNAIEIATHFFVIIIFTTLSIVIVPFIELYTSDIIDINYKAPIFGTVLSLAYASLCLRIPYFRLIKASGHFKETQNGAYISAIINVIVTAVGVRLFGLVGTAFGTLFAMLYHTIYFALYLRRNIIKRSIWIFIKHMAVDIIIICLSYFVTKNIFWTGDTYTDWFLYSLKIGITVVGISMLCSLVAFPRTLLAMIKKKK